MNLPCIPTCRECTLLSPISKQTILLQATLTLTASSLSYVPPLKAKLNVISFAAPFLKKATVIMKQTRNLVPYSKKNAYIFQPIHPQFFWTNLIHHHETEALLVKDPLSPSQFQMYHRGADRVLNVKNRLLSTKKCGKQAVLASSL